MALRVWLAATATVATPAAVASQTGPSVATVAVADPGNQGAHPAPATPEQARELGEFVVIVAADRPDDERAEALAVALAAEQNST